MTIEQMINAIRGTGPNGFGDPPPLRNDEIVVLLFASRAAPRFINPPFAADGDPCVVANRYGLEPPIQLCRTRTRSPVSCEVQSLPVDQAVPMADYIRQLLQYAPALIAEVIRNRFAQQAYDTQAELGGCHC